MALIVVVDDERTFKDEFFSDTPIYVRTSHEALAYLATHWTQQRYGYEDPIDALWLDHDLGAGGNITPVVRFLVACFHAGAPLEVGCIAVHSMNPVGSKNVYESLKGKYNVVQATLPPSN